MAVKAEEISAILKEKIEQYNFNPKKYQAYHKNT